MKRFLVIGDFHIPRRAREIPPPLSDVACAGGFDAVLCTGDLIGEEVLHLLHALAPRVVAVAGNMDHLDLPESETVEAEGWRIGVVHGSGVHPRGDAGTLARIAGDLGVHILVNGHTHADAVYACGAGTETRIFVNPGSATGIPGGTGGSLTPSLAVLELQPGGLRVVVHRLAACAATTEEHVFAR